jgi:hypothetical protein
MVPGLPRDALVDRAASLEGLAVHDLSSAQPLAAGGDPPRERASDASGAAAPRAPHGAADPLFRRAGIDLVRHAMTRIVRTA